MYTFNLEKWNNQKEPYFKSISYNLFKRLKIKPLLALAVANKIEKKAVLSSLKTFPKTHCKYIITCHNQTYYIGMFGAFPTVVVESTMGIDEPSSATLAINETILTWKVKIVISVGVAMGLKPQVQMLGDVLVSRMIQNYDKIKVTTKMRIDRSARPTSSNRLFDRFNNQNNWNFYDSNHRKCKIHSGLIITGGALVNDPKLANNLRTNYADAIGNEMEASGVWAASERSDVHWIVVKGICDWGYKKNDDYQPLAASAAVSLCKHVLKSETALDGIIKRTKIPNSEKQIRINSLKLYYFRNEKGMSTQDISSKTGISEMRIKALEAFNTPDLKFDYTEFPLSTPSEIKKIENVVCDGRRILKIENTPKDYMGYILSYYFKRKLKQIYPEIKAVVFDFDGTLTRTYKGYSTWQKIWLKLGYTINDCDNLHERFSQKEFSHQEWCDMTCKKFQDKGMTNRILYEIANEISLIEGTIPTLKKLRDNNIHLFIVSGSIRDVIIKVLGENNVHLFEEIKANNMEFNKDGSLKRIIGTKYDFDGKSEFIEKVAHTLGINTYNILFIGNSNNDQLAYKSGAITLCVNPRKTDPENKKIWHNIISEMQNLDEILSYINLNI